MNIAARNASSAIGRLKQREGKRGSSSCNIKDPVKPAPIQEMPEMNTYEVGSTSGVEGPGEDAPARQGDDTTARQGEDAAHTTPRSTRSTSEIVEEDAPPPRASEAPERAETAAQIRSSLARQMLAATFRPAEHLTDLSSCVNTNPHWFHTIWLGFEHSLVSLGGVVIAADMAVLALGGRSVDRIVVIQTMLFTSAFHTVAQTWMGSRLPTLIGPSLSYSLAILNIAKDIQTIPLLTDEEIFTHGIRAVQGSLIMSSFITIILGYGRVWRWLSRFITPIVVGPLILVMAISAAQIGFTQISECWGYGVPMFILLVASQYFKRFSPLCRSIVEKYSPLICIGVLWAFSGIMTAAGVHGIPKIGICASDRYNLLPAAHGAHIPYPFQWGFPIFRVSDFVGMMGAALVSSAEFTGSLLVVARLAGATPPPCGVITRSIGLQGVGQLLNGIFGAPFGPTASGLNIGLLGLTRIGSRRVAQISSCWMIFFSFANIGAFFASIPIGIFGGANLFFHGYVAGAGFSYMQFVNANTQRNVVVVGIPVILGLTVSSYFVIRDGQSRIHTHASWFDCIINTILGYPAMLVAVFGMVLDCTWEAEDRVDRGIPWWVPFQSMTGDIRSMEFYEFPVIIRSLIERFRGWIAKLRTRFLPAR